MLSRSSGSQDNRHPPDNGGTQLRDTTMCMTRKVLDLLTRPESVVGRNSPGSLSHLQVRSGIHYAWGYCRNLGKYEAAYTHALKTRAEALERVRAILEVARQA